MFITFLHNILIFNIFRDSLKSAHSNIFLLQRVHPKHVNFRSFYWSLMLPDMDIFFKKSDVESYISHLCIRAELKQELPLDTGQAEQALVSTHLTLHFSAFILGIFIFSYASSSTPHPRQ